MEKRPTDPTPAPIPREEPFPPPRKGESLVKWAARTLKLATREPRDLFGPPAEQYVHARLILGRDSAGLGEWRY